MAPATRSQRKTQAGKNGRKVDKKLSRNKKPDGLSLEEWQIQLRRDFGRELDYSLTNVGGHPFFSDFQVRNPNKGGATYSVVIRGQELGDNFCSCPDFATNSLGTCKHVEFTLAKLERKRGGKKALREGFQPEYSELYVEYGSQRAVRFRAGTDCPAKVARLIGDYFLDDGRLSEKGFDHFDTLLSKIGEIEHELRIREDVLPFVAQVRDGKLRQQRIDKLFPDGIHSSAFENLLNVSLYEYQREGSLFAAKAGRCLIGDDMGLGKTVQAIAATEILARSSGVERVLVICPTSLKHQWELEIQRFSGRDTTVIRGLLPVRAEQYRNDPAFFKITNYETVYRDLEAIADWAPDLVILDEAQRIKNWETRTAKSVKRVQSPYAIVLTGTPLENRLQELISIVGFVDQHRLGPTYRLLHDHQIVDGDGRVIGYQRLNEIAAEIKPIFLRRRKSEVLSQLPDRMQKDLFVPMTPKQWNIHAENHEAVGRIVAKWRRNGFLTEVEKQRLMIFLQNMRMSCDSTYLCKDEEDHSVKPDELINVLSEIFESSDSKVVIFSQWVKMHELIIRRLEQKGWGHVLFHGGVPSDKRKGLVEQFRNDPDCRIFLSTDAGGVGLNLQHANVIINMDLPWNPAVLEQRIGRVHRLGQKEKVQVINFVAEKSIEEGMLGVLAFKKSLFEGVLDGGECEVLLGDSRFKKFIESVESVTQHMGTRVTGDDFQDQDDQPEETKEAAEPAAEHIPVPEEVAEPERSAASHIGNGRAVAATAAAEMDPLTGLLQHGMRFLEQLSTAACTERNGDTGPRDTASSLGQLISMETDVQTGKQYVKFEMPEPQVLHKAAKALTDFLVAFQK